MSKAPPPIIYNDLRYYGFLKSKGLYYYQQPTIKGGRYLHRVIWEETHGQIPTGMLVHHINGDTLDNRIENLQLLSRLDHFYVHIPDPSSAGKIGGKIATGALKRRSSDHCRKTALVKWSNYYSKKKR